MLKIGKKKSAYYEYFNCIYFFYYSFNLFYIYLHSYIIHWHLQNAMEIRNVVNQTLSVTEPNVFLKDRDMEQTLLPLSLQLHFDLYKKGRKERYSNRRRENRLCIKYSNESKP
ncbi:sigma factor regulator N-terminal domain-containing protein [Bacillus pacificus]